MHRGQGNRWSAAVLGTALALGAGGAAALDVNLTADRATLQVAHHGRMVTVQRNQDPNHTVDPVWAKTSRQCPPFCLQPRTPVPGVTSVGELEVLEFMADQVNNGTGVLIDARLPDWHKRGTIPGSVNIPFTVFDHEPDHPTAVRALKYLGGKRRTNVGAVRRAYEELVGDESKTELWDFSDAKDVLLWCNGPWCGQSPRAIRALVKLGYPKSKIRYYRGGMQMWKVNGLTTVIPDPGETRFVAQGGGE